MSLYHIVFALLLVGVLIEYLIKETPKIYFYVSFIVLTLLLCLRFGQGTDYFSYNMIYHSMPLSVSGLMTYNYSSVEIGWRFICMAFRILNFSFRDFVAVHAIVEMILYFRFLSRYSQNHMLALFMSYHTLYLTYFFSAMRQGFVIAVFLGILLEWLLQGKYIRYIIGVLLCATIHTVAFILFVPLLFVFIRLSFSRIVCAVTVGFTLGIILSVLDMGTVMGKLVSSLYLGQTTVSLVAVAERIISYAFVTYVYYIYIDGCEPDQKTPHMNMFKIYSMGVFVYGVLMWSPIISSRTIYVLKVLEISIICISLIKCRRARDLVVLYCVLISSVLYLKNISNYIAEGDYKNVSVMNFPYTSVFEPGEILTYREIEDVPKQWLDTELK